MIGRRLFGFGKVGAFLDSLECVVEELVEAVRLFGCGRSLVELCLGLLGISCSLLFSLVEFAASFWRLRPNLPLSEYR